MERSNTSVISSSGCRWGRKRSRNAIEPKEQRLQQQRQQQPQQTKKPSLLLSLILILLFTGILLFAMTTIVSSSAATMLKSSAALSPSSSSSLIFSSLSSISLLQYNTNHYRGATGIASSSSTGGDGHNGIVGGVMAYSPSTITSSYYRYHKKHQQQQRQNMIAFLQDKQSIDRSNYNYYTNYRLFSSATDSDNDISNNQKNVDIPTNSTSNTTANTTRTYSSSTGNTTKNKLKAVRTISSAASSSSTTAPYDGEPFPNNTITSTSSTTKAPTYSSENINNRDTFMHPVNGEKMSSHNNNTDVSAAPKPVTTRMKDDTTMRTSDSNNNNETTSSGGMSNDNNNNNNNAFDANSVLAIDPSIIDIVTVSPEEQNQKDIEIMSNINNNYNNNNVNNHIKKISAMELFLQQLPFVEMFRGSANYIANHRNTIAVYHVPGGLVDTDKHDGNTSTTNTNNTVFRDLMNDVALTWLLGMKIVIVAGCRHQIERRIQTMASTTPPTTGDGISSYSHGLRVTDENTLRIVKEEAGYVRFEVERQLARSLRMHSGTTNTGVGVAASSSSSPPPPFLNNHMNAPISSNAGGTSTIIGGGARTPLLTGYDGNVVSGNFYSAQPFGILDGVDYKYSGFVRRVEVEKIKRLHESRDICLLTSLGVSPSGEVFNVNSESLAATVAGALGASKVIYFTEDDIELRHTIHQNKIHSLRYYDARNLLNYHGITIHSKGYTTLSDHAKTTLFDMPNDNTNGDDDDGGTVEQIVLSEHKNRLDMLLKIGWCMEAIARGVKRAHIISPKHGALLQELYTRDGSGTLVSADLYEGIRRADYHDVSSIHELIYPLIQMGTLIDRPKAQLEKDIDTYYVYTRDNSIVACGQLKKFENGFAEIGCLVVNKDFRSRGRGDAMLGYLERLCLLNQCNKIFVLSTQTMEWFIERGFKPAPVDDLPPSRQATYNYKRNSKIYLKIIENDRDLDASELWWNR